MLLLGDICVAENDNFIFDEKLMKVFGSNKSFGNLEGPININKIFHTKDTRMHNSSNILELFKIINLKGLSISNNHIFDWGEKYVLESTKYLKKNDIQSHGYKHRINSKLKTIEIKDKKKDYSFYSFGWSIVSCKKPTLFSPGVNTLNKKNIDFYLEEILPKISKDSIKVVYMHWCYEMEPYLQPLHRDFARKLIDGGVNLVVGSHPHIKGPIEKYKDGYIFYTLGNFLYSNNKFNNGKLKYPEITNTQFIIEINGLNKINIHTITTNRNKLEIIKSENIERFLIKLDLNLANLSSKEYYLFYKKWAKNNCRFLPIFSSNDSLIKKNINISSIYLRMLLIKLFIFLRIKRSGKRHFLKRINNFFINK